jgi:hypothetical protein
MINTFSYIEKVKCIRFIYNIYINNKKLMTSLLNDSNRLNQWQVRTHILPLRYLMKYIVLL